MGILLLLKNENKINLYIIEVDGTQQNNTQTCFEFLKRSQTHLFKFQTRPSRGGDKTGTRKNSSYCHPHFIHYIFI